MKGTTFHAKNTAIIRDSTKEVLQLGFFLFKEEDILFFQFFVAAHEFFDPANDAVRDAFSFFNREFRKVVNNTKVGSIIEVKEIVDTFLE